MPPALNTKQTDLLRYLCRQSGPVPQDHLDGRIVRALHSRGFISVRNGWAAPTDAGRAYSPGTTQRTRRKQQGTESPRSARAQMIMRAVEELERAMPIDAELLIGNVPAYGDDVLNGLRRLAREM